MSDKHKHLEFIQAVVSRLANNSFLVKGWSVVLVSALFALAAKEAKPLFVYLAYFPAIAFWILDGYFLWQERLYRRLYDRVRVVRETDIDFAMDPTDVGDDRPTWVGALMSQTLLLFHLAVLATIIVVMVVLSRAG